MPALAATASSPSLVRRLIRILLTLALALVVGRVAGYAMRMDSRLVAPAGLGRGILHGAMMPLAFPTLVTGHDSTIYAERNTGRTYKLGYTIGVNLCGAAFFSFAIRSLRRWRDGRVENGLPEPAADGNAGPSEVELSHGGRQ